MSEPNLAAKLAGASFDKLMALAGDEDETVRLEAGYELRKRCNPPAPGPDAARELDALKSLGRKHGWQEGGDHPMPLAVYYEQGFEELYEARAALADPGPVPDVEAAFDAWWMTDAWKGDGRCPVGPSDIARAAWNASRLLAAARGVPGDDAEPVTEEWLRMQGWTGPPKECYHPTDNRLFVEFGRQGPCTGNDSVVLYLKRHHEQPHLTRGHVRRLLAALGIDPPAPAPGPAKETT